MKEKFLIHKKSRDIFAVRTVGGKIIGATGPLSEMTAQTQLLPYFSYINGLGQLVQGQIGDFEPYRPNEIKKKEG